MGLIRELQEGKLKQDAERTGTKIEARMWLTVARAGSLRKKLGFTKEVGDAGDWIQAVVQKWEADRAAAAWRRKVDARIQRLYAMGMETQAAQAAQALLGVGSRTKETGSDLFDRTGTGTEHGAGTGMGMGRCCR